MAGIAGPDPPSRATGGATFVGRSRPPGNGHAKCPVAPLNNKVGGRFPPGAVAITDQISERISARLRSYSCCEMKPESSSR